LRGQTIRFAPPMCITQADADFLLITGPDDDTLGVEAAFKKIRAPLKVVHRDEERVREVYGASVFLLRPDLHIAWRGERCPEDATELAALATGWQPPARAQLNLAS